MDERQEQLVQHVAREVLAVLRQRGLVPAPAGAEAPAPVRPPLGTCTGDYAKFPELQGRVGGAGAPAGAAPSQPAEPAAASPEPVPLGGIITATQLQAAMDAAPDGVAVLAADARLTPLAADLARQHPRRIRRAPVRPAAAVGATATAAADLLPWLWWTDGQCPAVAQITKERPLRLRPSSAARQHTSLLEVVREISAGLRAGHIGGALLFVHSAARALCYANRCAAVRAVVGTCGEAVEQGIGDLGANVLVLEFPHVGPRAMAAMVDRMLQQPARVSTAMQRELAELHRCG